LREPGHNSNDNGDCAKLIQQIHSLTSELKKRYADLINDKLGLPERGPMSIAGHKQQS
jgi:hypothetical protein